MNGLHARQKAPTRKKSLRVERAQTGVRIEKRLLATLNAIAREEKQELGWVIEDMALHAFEGHGACAWGGETLKRIQRISKEEGLHYGPHGCYSFQERGGPASLRYSGSRPQPSLPIQRAQAGFKLEKRLLRVLKAIAEGQDATLGQSIEEIALHQLAGVDAFGKETIRKIQLLKKVYDMDYDAHDNYRFRE